MQYRGPLKGVFLWKSSPIPARRPLPPGGSLPKRCRAGRSSRSPAGWAQARQRSARAWPRGWAAPTRFPARRSPSSTTTAARAHWPTLIYTASTPRTTLPPPGSTTIWTWARWLPASGARTVPTCSSRSSPSISTSTGWTRRRAKLRLVDFIDFIT